MRRFRPENSGATRASSTSPGIRSARIHVSFRMGRRWMAGCRRHGDVAATPKSRRSGCPKAAAVAEAGPVDKALLLLASVFFYRAQAIAVAVRRPEEFRVVGIGLDLLPEPRDRLVDSPRHCRIDEIAPYLSQQFVAMDDAIAPLREVAQQFEFAVREAHRLIAASGSLRPEVDQQPSDSHALDRGMRAAKHCPNARKQLVEIDRFGDVVVGAELQPG